MNRLRPMISPVGKEGLIISNTNGLVWTSKRQRLKTNCGRSRKQWQIEEARKTWGQVNSTYQYQYYFCVCSPACRWHHVVWFESRVPAKIRCYIMFSSLFFPPNLGVSHPEAFWHACCIVHWASARRNDISWSIEKASNIGHSAFDFWWFMHDTIHTMPCIHYACCCAYM